MKKVVVLIIFVFNAYLSMIYCQTSFTNFKGSWDFDDNSSGFSLVLNQTNNTISGNHCGTAYNGSFIDCSDGSDGNSVNGIVQDGSAIITFLSTYCNSIGNAVIKKISPTQIRWTVTKKPDGGTLYLPLDVVMNLFTEAGSFTMLPGYNYLTSNITNYGNYASFYLVFYPSSTMAVGSSYRVATVSANCRPTVARALSFTTGGRTWSITMNPNGDVYASIVSGSGISGSPYPTNNVVSLGTLFYDF